MNADRGRALRPLWIVASLGFADAREHVVVLALDDAIENERASARALLLAAVGSDLGGALALALGFGRFGAFAAGEQEQDRDEPHAPLSITLLS